MKKYSILLSAAILFSSLTLYPAVAKEYAGSELGKAMKISRAAVQRSGDSLVIKTAGKNHSAIYQEKLNWQTDNIKQIVVNAKADQEGMLRFSANTFVDGKRLSINIYCKVVPDGEFHNYYFNTAGNKNWQGVLANYELRWFGPADTLIEFRKITASDTIAVNLTGSDLKRNVKLFNAVPAESAGEYLAQTTRDFGGFHQQKLEWNADRINRVSFWFKSDKPGTLRYACSLKIADSKKLAGISLPVQKVPGDNQYHLYTFNLTANPKFSGIQTNYELRFTGEKGAVIGLKEVTAEKAAGDIKTEKAAAAYPYELKTSSTAPADGIVKCGETVTLKVQALKNGKPVTGDDLYLSVRCFSDGEGSKTVTAPIDKVFAWNVTRKEPGRAYISCRIRSKSDPNTLIKVQNPRNSQHLLTEHGIGIWADPQQQRIQRKEPADFDKFWAEKKAELAKVPVKVLEKVAFDADGKESFDIFDVKIACAGPVPVSGIITIPKNKSRKYPAVVQYHGAGVRSAYAYVQSGAITFNVNAHGLPNGRDKSFYEVITRDKSRNPYMQSAEKRFEMFQYMFLRALRALEYVRTLPEWNGRDLIVSGGSQGGVQSIAAAALDKSVTLAVPSIPAMIGVAEFTIRKNVEPAWPNPYTREFFNKQDISAIAGKFDYVDGAFLMRRVNCPIYVSIGLYDTIAAHVYAAFNDCPAGEKVIATIADMGHYNANPPGRKAIARVLTSQVQ